MRLPILASLAALAALAVSAPADAATLVGKKSVRSQQGELKPGTARAFSVKSTAAGSATSVTVYLGRSTRAKGLRIGLYADKAGRPGARLATGNRRKLRRGAWNRVTVPATPVAAQTKYWIAVLGTGGRLAVRLKRARKSCRSVQAARRGLTSLPRRWRTGTRPRTCSLSAYVSGRQGAVVPAPAPVAPVRCDRRAADAATLAAEFGAATPGQTVCLASGDYGEFRGGVKPGEVVVRGDAGATATMAVRFSGASNVTLADLTIRELNYEPKVSRVTVRGSRFTGLAYVDATNMRDAAVLFDDNDHVDIDLSSEREAPGRIHVDAGNVNEGTPSGIVIRNSLFKGGTADGIRADGGASIVIEGNEFTGMRDVDPYHADAIQFVGGQNVTIRGNYFHDQAEMASCSLGQHDGGSGHLIERNVIEGGGCYFGMYLRADRDSVVRHNTFVAGPCIKGTCGQIVIDGKDSGGSGTLFENNIFTNLVNEGGVPSQFTARHNLTRSATPGTGNRVGTPSFVGGANPTTYEGFKLAPGSPGKAAASDGSDIGI